MTESKGKALYIGGFELPDKNAAAQRVIGIAKGLRKLHYEVIFLNSLKQCDRSEMEEVEYFGFKCYEYQREPDWDYLLMAKTCLINIKHIKPDIIIAYNYPGFALERIRKYCRANKIRCFADATEWYQVLSGSLPYRLIKTIDTSFRMRIVQKKLDGVIAISRFLYDYYNSHTTRTVLIPPTVDITDEKWKATVPKDSEGLSFIYAGSPSAQKERLDLIVSSIEKMKAQKRVRLNVVGITENQFRNIYQYQNAISERIIFWGRVDHRKAVKMIKAADWSIILRDDNFVVHAGFPTKLVESASCGTPVIINKFSNVDDFVNQYNSIIIERPDDIENGIKRVEGCNIMIDNTIFDYHRYLIELQELLAKDK